MTVLLSVQGLLLIKSLVPLFRLFLALMQTTNSLLFTSLIAVDGVLGYQHMPILATIALLLFLLLSQLCFILSICVTNTQGLSLWLQEIWARTLQYMCLVA